MAKKKAYVFTFGRFQPPTTGHEKLINTVVDHAKKIGADHGIYTSQRSDANRPRAEIKDPLEYGDKIKFLKKMFPQANIVKGGAEISTFMDVLYELQKKGYTTVHMVVGGDRIPGIRNTVKPYLNSDDEETALNFEEFKLVNAGKRDPEATGVEGMSGSKLRALVKDNNFKEFKKGMPSGFSGARELFDALKKGLEPMKKGKKIEEKREIVREVSPPDEESERFIKKSKASFKDRYGEDWASYLYGTAWKMYNKRHGLDDGEGEEMKEETMQKSGINPLKWISDPKSKEGYGVEKQDYTAKGGKTYTILRMRLDPGAGAATVFKVQGQKKQYDSLKKLLADLDSSSGGSKQKRSWTPAGKDDPDINYGGRWEEYSKPIGVLEGMTESALNEGGMKGALEDWLYDLPKKVIAEIKDKFGKKLKAADMSGAFVIDSETREKIRQILVRNKVKPLLGDKNHAEGTSAIIMSFHTFHGDLDESVELNEGTARYKLSLPEIRYEYIESEGLDGTSIIGTQTIKVYPILKNGKKVGYLKYENRYGSLSGELHGKELFKDYEYPPRGDVYSWFSKFIKSSRGKKFVKESVELDEGSYVHSSAELKAAIKGSQEEIKSLTAKLKMFKKIGLSKESIEKIEDQIQFWQDNLADAEEQLKGMKESVELDEVTIPRDAKVVDRNKEEKTVTLKWNDEDGWHEEEVPEDEVPGFYDRAADPMKQRKTDRFGNIMKTPAKGAEKKTEKAMAANKKDAEEILAIFKKKPMKTPITVIGTKWGKSEEYEMVVMKRMYQGEEVFVVKSSGRFVELRPSAAGLQVIDQKTKKILLDKGKDAVW